MEKCRIDGCYRFLTVNQQRNHILSVHRIPEGVEISCELCFLQMFDQKDLMYHLVICHRFSILRCNLHIMRYVLNCKTAPRDVECTLQEESRPRKKLRRF